MTIEEKLKHIEKQLWSTPYCFKTIIKDNYIVICTLKPDIWEGKCSLNFTICNDSEVMGEDVLATVCRTVEKDIKRDNTKERVEEANKLLEEELEKFDVKEALKMCYPTPVNKEEG